MDKIKAFFENRIVIIVEAVIIALCSAGLIFGGVSAEEVATIPALVVGILGAIVAFITFVKGLLPKKA